MTYLNKLNFNINYGVHVLHSYWRMRIGTAILRKALEISKDMGARYVSVVRTLRTLCSSSSDRRAILFYRANRSCLRLNII